MATSRLIRPPRKSRPLTGSGRLPNPENLVKKSAEDLVRTLNRFGIDPDLKAIELRANRSFGRIEKILTEGLIPDEATWKSITDQHKREVEQSLRRMTKQAIRLYRTSKLESPNLMWLTVADTKVCPSCEPRHGQVKTIEAWVRTGMPGSSALVCGEECRCQLVPVF